MPYVFHPHTHVSANCFQCGRPLPPEADGRWPIALEVNGTDCEIPGLWSCRVCTELSKLTQRVNIDAEAALCWLECRVIPAFAVPNAQAAQAHLGIPAAVSRAFAEQRLAVAVASRDMIAAWLESMQPDDLSWLTETEPAVLKAVLSLELDADGFITFLCPNCDSRHRVTDFSEDFPLAALEAISRAWNSK